MSIILQDPHNHVPDVSPGDAWDDAGDFDPGTVLPPRREAKPEPPEGLRIELNPEPLIASDAPRPADGQAALEIQQIDGTVIRLTPEEPGPPPSWRQVAYPEQAIYGAEARMAMAEPRRWGTGRMPPVYWLVGTGVGVTASVIVGLVMLPSINRINAARPDQAVHLVIDPRESSPEFESLKRMAARQSEAEGVFLAYAKAGSSPDALRFVHDAGRIGSLPGGGLFPAEIPADWHPGAPFSWNAAGEGADAYGVLSGNLPDFSAFRVYLRDSGGQLAIDWKASVAFGTASFSELAAGQGDGAEIRGLLRASNYYNLAFPEAEYRCYQLACPVGGQSLWCYARRKSATGDELAAICPDGELLRSGHEPVRVTLRLAPGPESAQPNQWRIEEVLHNEWISPYIPPR